MEESGEGAQEGLGDAAIMQATSGGNGFGGIAGLFGAAVLGLQQVDVTAAGDVEGMALRAEELFAVAKQRLVAVADGTEEHPVECSGQMRKVRFLVTLWRLTLLGLGCWKTGEVAERIMGTSSRKRTRKNEEAMN